MPVEGKGQGRGSNLRSISNCVLGHTWKGREEWQKVEEEVIQVREILGQVEGESRVEQPLAAMLGGTCLSCTLEVDIEGLP